MERKRGRLMVRKRKFMTGRGYPTSNNTLIEYPRIRIRIYCSLSLKVRVSYPIGTMKDTLQICPNHQGHRNRPIKIPSSNPSHISLRKSLIKNCCLLPVRSYRLSKLPITGINLSLQGWIWWCNRFVVSQQIRFHLNRWRKVGRRGFWANEIYYKVWTGRTRCLAPKTSPIWYRSTVWTVSRCTICTISTNHSKKCRCCVSPRPKQCLVTV